jgi:hypothetical protein
MRGAILLALVLAVPTTAVAQVAESGHVSFERSNKIQLELGRRAATLQLHQLEERRQRALREVVASAVLVGVGGLSVLAGVGVIVEDPDGLLAGIISACAGGLLTLISGIWLGVADGERTDADDELMTLQLGDLEASVDVAPTIGGGSLVLRGAF